MTPYSMFRLNPGDASGNSLPVAGDSLPASTATMGDWGGLPWHPDSPGFWLLVVAGATVLGILGASVDVRAGKARAGGHVGKP